MSGRLTVREGGRFCVFAVLFALLMVTSLVTAVPVASAAQDQEPNDSRDGAQQIQIGEQITGEVAPSDTDWFAFTVQRGETINVSAAAAGGDLATEFNLITPDGNNPTGARLKGDTDFFGITATTTGTYYIEVKGVSPDRGGEEYNFTVETYETDDFETNEERANATGISVGEEVNGTVSVGDADWFAFTAERGETINVTAAAAGDRRDLATEFNLITPDDKNPTGARLEGQTDFFGITATTTGTYYIEVKGVSPDRGGDDYNFTVETYETDDFEPNEDKANASSLYVNPFPTDTATVSVGDRDWFRFDATQGETINVTAAAAGSRGDLATEFDLITPDGSNPTGARLEGQTDFFGITATTTGTYYLEIKGVSPDRGGDDYNFTVDAGGTLLGLPNDRFERPNPPVGNNDQDNATEIDAGTYRDLGIVDDDSDVFSFRAAQDARVVANVSYDAAANNLSLNLTDASGATVATGGDGLATNVSDAGTYYLAVTGQADAEATYALALNVSAAGPGAVPGQAQAPTDTDGDGRYEDVNGDGGLNVIDVSILLGTFDRIPSGEVPFYDFNGDGQLNILDVSALLGQT